MSYKKHWRIGVVLLVVGLLVFGTILTAFALPKTGNGVEPIYLDKDTDIKAQPDPKPEDLESPGCILKTVKIDDPVAGYLENQTGQVEKSDPTSNFDVEIYNISGNTFSFKNANMPIYYVWVKAGAGGYLYSYPDGVYDDTGLYSPQPDSISHITFYYCDVPLYNICGIKYNDDTNEPIAGWAITLEKVELVEGEWEADDTFPSRTVYTADGTLETTLGQYCFEGLRAGTYRLTEEERANWTNVSHSTYVLTIPANTEDLPGTTYYRNFTNAPLYNVCGMKYDYDSEDAGVFEGLDNWEITLQKLMYCQDAEDWIIDPEFTLRTVFTNDGTNETTLGQYCFKGLRAGKYLVREVMQAGWTDVYGREFVVDIPIGEVPGTTYEQDFYNTRITYETRCETAWAYDPENNTPFTSLGLKNWGWTNGSFGPGTYTLQLWAGAGRNDLNKGTLVGTVEVEYVNGVATVTYSLKDGFTLKEAHLYVGNERLPKSKQGTYTNAPGQFPYKGETTTFIVEGLSGEIWVAAHAVVCGNFAKDDNDENGEGMGMPAKHGMTGEEFGKKVSEKAKGNPGAIADHVKKEKEPKVEPPQRGRPEE